MSTQKQTRKHESTKTRKALRKTLAGVCSVLRTSSFRPKRQRSGEIPFRGAFSSSTRENGISHCVRNDIPGELKSLLGWRLWSAKGWDSGIMEPRSSGVCYPGRRSTGMLPANPADAPPPQYGATCPRNLRQRQHAPAHRPTLPAPASGQHPPRCIRCLPTALDAFPSAPSAASASQRFRPPAPFVLSPLSCFRDGSAKGWPTEAYPRSAMGRYTWPVPWRAAGWWALSSCPCRS